MPVPGSKGEDHPALLDPFEDQGCGFAVLFLMFPDLRENTFQIIQILVCVFHLHSIAPDINHAKSSVISSVAPLGIGDIMLS